MQDGKVIQKYQEHRMSIRTIATGTLNYKFQGDLEVCCVGSDDSRVSVWIV